MLSMLIVPTTGNETISMAKTTSLAMYVPCSELLFRAQNIYSRTYQEIPILLMVSGWYLALTSLLMLVQMRIERHYGRGFDGASASGQSLESASSTGRRMSPLGAFFGRA